MLAAFGGPGLLSTDRSQYRERRITTEKKKKKPTRAIHLEREWGVSSRLVPTMEDDRGNDKDKININDSGEKMIRIIPDLQNGRIGSRKVDGIRKTWWTDRKGQLLGCPVANWGSWSRAAETAGSLKLFSSTAQPHYRVRAWLITIVLIYLSSSSLHSFTSTNRVLYRKLEKLCVTVLDVRSQASSLYIFKVIHYISGRGWKIPF